MEKLQKAVKSRITKIKNILKMWNEALAISECQNDTFCLNGFQRLFDHNIHSVSVTLTIMSQFLRFDKSTIIGKY